MDPETWKSIEELFFAALELPAAGREAFLARECARDPVLRAEVESLIRAHEAEEGLRIERALLRDDATADEPVRAGAFAGAWRLERRLGRGGMGDVWLGERDGGDFRQRAAIKFVRSGWRVGELLARFRRERRVLARLAHPNIAKLLDGGSTGTGEPWLAMEFVEGAPITEWCDAGRLDVRQRLGIFLQVCAAVRFAHANLVVHRDLKPANIMVTPEGRAAAAGLRDRQAAAGG